VTVLGEPQLSKNGLYPTLSTRSTQKTVELMMNVIAYSDGTHSLLDIAEITGSPMWDIVPIFHKLNGTVLIKLNEKEL
jgi:aminopeptidase-like protein